MCADERKVVAPEMIVSGARFPMIVVMTAGTLNAESVRMHVVRAVTAEAVLRQLLLVIATTMAGKAIECIMRAR